MKLLDKLVELEGGRGGRGEGDKVCTFLTFCACYCFFILLTVLGDAKLIMSFA